MMKVYSLEQLQRIVAEADGPIAHVTLVENKGCGNFYISLHLQAVVSLSLFKKIASIGRHKHGEFDAQKKFLSVKLFPMAQADRCTYIGRPALRIDGDYILERQFAETDYVLSDAGIKLIAVLMQLSRDKTKTFGSVREAFAARDAKRVDQYYKNDPRPPWNRVPREEMDMPMQDADGNWYDAEY
jgi:hypothetical protein